MPTANLQGSYDVAAGDPLAYTATGVSRIVDPWGDLRPVVGYASSPASVGESVDYIEILPPAVPLPVPEGHAVTRGKYVRAVGAGYGDVIGAGPALAPVFGIAAQSASGPAAAMIHVCPSTCGLEI